MTSVYKQLHKFQMPLLGLLRQKMTKKEKEKRTLLETLSCRRKKHREWLFIKRKEKIKNIFRDLVSKKKKRHF